MWCAAIQGRTPLSIAAMKAEDRLVRMLLQAGAGIHPRELALRDSPLVRGAEARHGPTFRALSDAAFADPAERKFALSVLCTAIAGTSNSGPILDAITDRGYVYQQLGTVATTRTVEEAYMQQHEDVRTITSTHPEVCSSKNTDDLPRIGEHALKSPIHSSCFLHRAMIQDQAKLDELLPCANARSSFSQAQFVFCLLILQNFMIF